MGTNKQLEKLGRDKNGRFVEGGVGNPNGRPKGSKNKFTLIKEEMVDVWHENEGKELFKELFKAGSPGFLKALEKIVCILPKDPIIDQSQHFTKVVYGWSEEDKDKLQTSRIPERESVSPGEV